MTTINFLVTGVGGQGALLASGILADVGVRAGYDVKKSEVHGMAQRGGSVTSTVRWGDKVYSPLISQGEADYLLAMWGCCAPVGQPSWATWASLPSL
jgi:indolepyruvate ferredoxin oxidoreductase beta subunit